MVDFFVKKQDVFIKRKKRRGINDFAVFDSRRVSKSALEQIFELGDTESALEFVKNIYDQQTFDEFFPALPEEPEIPPEKDIWHIFFQWQSGDPTPEVTIDWYTEDEEEAKDMRDKIEEYYGREPTFEKQSIPDLEPIPTSKLTYDETNAEYSNKEDLWVIS